MRLNGTVPVKVPVSRSRTIPGPETIPSYWHPYRAGVRKAPAWFMSELDRLGWDEIEITWNPIRERWQVFSKAPRLEHKLCWGWRLLFIHSGPDGEYLPLDERVLARLYDSSSMAHGDGRKYFDRLVSEMKRDKEKREQAEFQNTMDAAIERGWDYTRIKNIGKGSKFSTYHA